MWIRLFLSTEPQRPRKKGMEIREAHKGASVAAEVLQQKAGIEVHGSQIHFAPAKGQ